MTVEELKEKARLPEFYEFEILKKGRRVKAKEHSGDSPKELLAFQTGLDAMSNIFLKWCDDNNVYQVIATFNRKAEPEIGSYAESSIKKVTFRPVSEVLRNGK